MDKMPQNDFPEFLKIFLNKFAKTRFYKKSLESRREGHEHVPEDKYYLFCDWYFENKDPWNDIKEHNSLGYCEFGDRASYKYDRVKAICINFDDGVVWVKGGISFGWHGTGIRSSNRPAPKYMRALINQLFVDYTVWREIRCRATTTICNLNSI